MTTYVRIFQSAIDPSDVDEVRRLWAEDVRPALQRVSGCAGAELVTSVERNAGGLLESAAISRWTSREAMEEAVESREMKEALVRILGLLHQEPVIRVFQVTA